MRGGGEGDSTSVECLFSITPLPQQLGVLGVPLDHDLVRAVALHLGRVHVLERLGVAAQVESTSFIMFQLLSRAGTRRGQPGRNLGATGALSMDQSLVVSCMLVIWPKVSS